MSHPESDRNPCPWFPLGLGLPLWEVGAFPGAGPGCRLGGRARILRAQTLLRARFLSDSCDSWREEGCKAAPNCSGLPDPYLGLLPLTSRSTNLPGVAAPTEKAPSPGSLWWWR